MGTSPLNKF